MKDNKIINIQECIKLIKMNANTAYSTSLKRMIGFKLFPTINPQSLQITNQKTVRKEDLPNGVKADVQHRYIVKQKLTEKKKHEKSIEEEVDKILRKMTEQGTADLNNNKVRRRGRYNHFRIISEPDEPKVTERIELPEVQSKLPTNPGGIKRMKTETSISKTRREFSEKKGDETQIVNVGRYLRHYREGMSSLKSLKYKRTD